MTESEFIQQLRDENAVMREQLAARNGPRPCTCDHCVELAENPGPVRGCHCHKCMVRREQA